MSEVVLASLQKINSYVASYLCVGSQCLFVLFQVSKSSMHLYSSRLKAASQQVRRLTYAPRIQDTVSSLESGTVPLSLKP